MISGIGGSNYSASLQPGQQKSASGSSQGAQRSGNGKGFQQIDTDGSGSVDKAEFQVVADKISGVTGKQINVEELTKSHDANGDGLLGQSEMQTLMMELRPSQSQGGAPTQQALSAYQQQVATDKDLTSTLMDMLGGTEEDDKNGTSSVNTNA